MNNIQKSIVFLLVLLLSMGSTPFIGVNAITSNNCEFLLMPTQIVYSVAPVKKTKILKRKYSVQKFSIQKAQYGNVISYEQSENLLEPGKPILPADTTSIVLKPNETIAYIKTTNIEATKIPLNSIPLLKAEEPKQISDQTIQNENPAQNYTTTADEFKEVYPQRNVDYIITGNQKERQLFITCYPVYILDGDMYVVTEITLEIGYIQNDSFTKGKQSKNSIILAPSEFKEEAEELALIQEADGFLVKVALLDELKDKKEAEIPIYPGVNGFFDTTEITRKRVSAFDYQMAFKIRTYLQELLEQDKIDYLTILGDATCVPPSYYVLSPDGFGTYDMWVPTDIYFVSPRANGKDIPMEIAVGRLSVRDKDEAKAVVKKQKRYRDALKKDDSWCNKAAIMAGAPFGNHFIGELATSKAVNLDYFDGMQIEKYYRSENLFNKNAFIDVLKEGERGFVWAFGHGSGEGLALEPGYANAADLLNIPLKSKLPIIFSEACGNGAWDTRLADAPFKNNTKYAYPTSFSEAVVLSEGAGIAYVGGARINYAGWYLEYNNGIAHLKSVHYMDAILELFMRAHSEGNGSLGNWSQKALEYFAQEEAIRGMNAANIKTFFGFTLQGDPTITLPFVSDSTPTTTPIIKEIKTQPTDFNNWPLFSIDDGQEVNVTTDAKKLKYILCDYSKMNDPYVKEGYLDLDSDEDYKHMFKELEKINYGIRFLTPDMKESRIVFHGRYNNDVKIQHSQSLSLIRTNETSKRYVEIKNEGINAIDEVEVVAKKNDNEFSRQKYNSIPVFSTKYFFYDVNAEVSGENEITIQTDGLDLESNPEDNIFTDKYTITGENILRVGVLHGNTAVDSNYADNALNFTDLNKYFSENNDNIEINYVPLQFNDEGISTFETMGFDVVILYSNNFSPIKPLLQTQAALERFTQNGGNVLGILSLGRNRMGINLQPIQSFFGIDPSLRFSLYRTSNSSVDLSIEGFDGLKDNYSIQNRYTVIPKGKNWKMIDLEGDTEIIAIDKEAYTCLIKNGNRWFYSGFFSKTDFKAKEDTKTFFIDILKIMKKSTQEVLIKSVSVEPSIPTINEESKISVQIVNTGMVTISKGALEFYEQKVLFENLLPRESRWISFSFSSKEVGNHTESITLICETDTNEKNNKIEFSFHVKEEEKEKIIPTLEIIRKTTSEDTVRITGKVEPPGASILWNENTIETNYDGTFVLLLDRKFSEMNITPVIGKIQGDVFVEKIEWRDDVSLKMFPGDKRAFLNDKVFLLKEPITRVADCSMYPLRDVIESLGGTVGWDNDTKSILLKKEDRTVSLILNNKVVLVNGEEKNLKDAPININGTAMGSLDLISFAIDVNIVAHRVGAMVFWSTVPAKQLENAEKQFNTESDDLETIEPPFGKEKYPMANISCFDYYNEEIFLLNSTGIYKIEDEEPVLEMEFTKELIRNKVDFVKKSQTADQMAFRVSKDYIVVSMVTSFVVFNRETKEQQCIIKQEPSNGFLQPITNYQQPVDMEIHDGQLFILDIYYGFSIFNLDDGTLASKIYYPNYLYNFEFYGDRIIACSYWGLIASMNIDGLELVEQEIPIGYCFRIFVENEYSCYVVSLSDAAALYHFDLSKDTEEQVDRIIVDTGYNVIDRMLFTEDTVYALAYTYNKNSKNDLKNGFLTLDKELNVKKDWFKDITKEANKDETYLPNTKSIYRIPETDLLAIEQSIPFSDQYVRLYNVKSGEIDKVSIRTEDPTYDHIFATYWYENKYSAFYRNQKDNTYWFTQYSFDENAKKTQEVSVQLNTNKKFNTSTLAVNENGFCIYDVNDTKIYWFDMDGEIQDQCYLQSGEYDIQVPYSINDLYIDDDDEVTILDGEGKSIFKYDTEGFLNRESLLFLGSNFKPSSMRIAEEDYTLLDQVNSKLCKVNNFVTHEIISGEQIQEGSIGSFSEYNNTLFIYDKQVGNIISYEEKKLFEKHEFSEEDIIVYPSAFTVKPYPNLGSFEQNFVLMIQGKYETIEFDYPKDLIEVHYKYDYSTYQQKRNIFEVVFSLQGVREQKDTTNIDITIVVDGVKRIIPVTVKAEDPKWTFMNESPFISINGWATIGDLRPIVKNEQIWLAPRDLSYFFQTTYKIDKDKIVIVSPKGTFTAKIGDDFYYFQDLKGESKKIDQKLIQPVGTTRCLVRADIVLKKMGAIIEYPTATGETATVEGWNLVKDS